MFKLRLIPGIFNLKSRISYKSIYVQHVQILGFLQVLLPNILAVLVSCSIRGLTYLLRQPDRKPFLGAARGGQQAPVQNNDIQWTANEVHCRTHQKLEKSIPANIVCTSVHCSFILFHPFLEAAMQKSSAQTRNQQIWRQLSYSSTSPVAGILLNPGPWLPEGHQVLRLSPSRSPASNIPSLRKDQKKYFTSGIYHLSFHPTICSIMFNSSFFHHLHHLSCPIFFAGFPISYLSTPSATSTPGTSPPRCHHLVMKPRPTPLAKGKPISGTHLEGNLRGLLKGLMIHGRSPGDVLFQTHHPTTILETFFENRCMGYR